MTQDQIDALERSCDETMRLKAPQLYARMLEARRIHNNGDGPESESVVRVAEPPSDQAIEAMIGALMIESFAAASRSFGLAQQCAFPGGEQLRSVHIGQAARLATAFGELVGAHARHRGKSQRLILEHHVRREGVSEAEK
jgi:hypothetical protein